MTTATANLTEHDLRVAGACPEGLAFYRATWPDHRTTPPAWATVCAALGDADACPDGVAWWEWLVEQRLPPADLIAEYERVNAPAWVEYQRAVDAAWAEYQRVNAPALAEYQRVNAPALAEYERATAPARAEYQRVDAPAWAEYERVVRAWLSTAGGL